MAITWDAEADAKLLVGIVTTSNTAIDFEKLAEFMGQGKYPPTAFLLKRNLASYCTVSALRHRIQRIKEKAGLTNAKGVAPKSPSTPKTKRSTPMKATKSAPKNTPKRKSAVSKDTEQTDEQHVKSEPEEFDHDRYLA
ncbi:hypothetical protein N7509_008843 [Penicillium cosmopolitanum]|uniref:AT hook motif protein n=1 Tax=Penicillium cosmopolitanum TaxID=1131564 RepID=A0A9X0B328_9EURO|nr:uncharacterized protein N7509_008843 [Penicillium cosmopolitanum]KAJ5386302.1 hypothetical protein N7509_008843 [Penicillium cosmopolitanum]